MLAIVMHMLCPNVVNMFLIFKSLWFLERGVSINDEQVLVQKVITLIKKSGKGRQEWAKPCKDASIHPRMLT
jgi:hypothetical protein